MTDGTVHLDRGAVDLVVAESGSGPTFVWAHALLASMQAEDRSGVFDWSDTDTRLIRYDARSHGRSSRDPMAEHHQWDALGRDMLAIAGYAGSDRAIFGGASMGAATAIWAACLAPERVRALVLVIPPTAWRERRRQARLYRGLSAAMATHVLLPATLGLRLPRPRPRRGTRGALVDAVLDEVGRSADTHLAAPLRGAALSDLPPLDRIRSIDVPTLILAWSGDRSHPVSVARQLASVMPRAELHVTDRDVTTWPDQVAQFVADLPPEHHEN